MAQQIQIRRKLARIAYAANGNVHNPNREYRWDAHDETGRLLDVFYRLRDARAEFPNAKIVRDESVTTSRERGETIMSAPEQLSPAIGSNRFCGPAAIAIVAGCSTDEAAAAIRAVSGKRKVFGVSNIALLAALTHIGVGHQAVTLDEYYGGSRPSLATFGSLVAAGVYVVNVTHHYVVIDTRQETSTACDNCTVYPLPLMRYRQRGKHVRAAWKIA